MKCDNCGYDSLTDFTVCPVCDKPCNIASNSENKEDEYVSINPAGNNPDFYNNPNMNPHVQILHERPEKLPKGYFEGSNGFRIKQTVKDGDFYQSYLLYNVFLFCVCTVIFFILFFRSSAFFLLQMGEFMALCFYCFIDLLASVLAYYLLYLLTGWIYYILFNSFSFDVTQDGIYVTSVMRKYFIDKRNLTNFNYEPITKQLDELDKFNLYSNIYYNQFKTSESRYYNSNRRNSRYTGDVNYARIYSGIGKKEPTKRREYSIFFTLESPIFVNNGFALSGKKYLNTINTGLSFEYASEARFLVDEFKRVLQIGL